MLSIPSPPALQAPSQASETAEQELMETQNSFLRQVLLVRCPKTNSRLRKEMNLLKSDTSTYLEGNKMKSLTNGYVEYQSKRVPYTKEHTR